MGPKSKRVFIFFIFAVALYIPTGVYAAVTELYFSPASGLHNIGDTFSVHVKVLSPEKTMNAVSGTITYPKNLLKITSLSDTSSVISLWVQEPTFSNQTGSASMEGIVLNPKFTTKPQTFITINFQVLAAGNATINLSSGSVLAHDGEATNILDKLGSATFTLGGVSLPAPEATTPVDTVNTPNAPIITSSTHPNPSVWYTNTTAKFAWGIYPDITGTRLLLSGTPQAIPTVTYTPPLDTRSVSDIDDGIWYFHAQLENEFGWGSATHFRIQIDTLPPEYFSATAQNRTDKTKPNISVVFDSFDKTSGVDRYEILIDGTVSDIWIDDGTGIYITPTLGPGEHTMIATAIDGAGNGLSTSETFIIDALPTPKILKYPSVLGSEDLLIIEGTALANASVMFSFQDSGGDVQTYTTPVDSEGKFVFIADETPNNGIYTFWAETIDERGARSLPTEEFKIAIQKRLIFRIGSLAVSFLAVFIPLLALILLLVFMVWYMWYRFILFRKHARKETNEALKVLHEAFDSLRKDAQKHIRLLKTTSGKRALTTEEKKVATGLKKSLDTAEKKITKEVGDIAKLIK